MMEKPKENFSWAYSIFTLIGLTILGFIIVVFASVFSSSDFESLEGNVAVIPIKGVIMADDDNAFFEDIVSSTDTVELIEKAADNENIKAIILEINSPGGSAVASEEIANAVKKTNKTTVAWIREVGASGGYWIASSSDYIVANRLSITGSIGVIASYLEFSGFLDRYNITYERLVAGKYKDIGSPFKDMTPEERMVFQQSLDEMRDYFASEVAKNRNINKKDIDKIANGMFFTGAQAKTLGLVDELGGKGEAIAYIEKKEGITAELVDYETEKGFFDLISSAMSKQSFFVGKGIGSSVLDRKAVSSVIVNT